MVELDTLLLEVFNQMQVLAHDRVKLNLGNYRSGVGMRRSGSPKTSGGESDWKCDQLHTQGRRDHGRAG